MFSLREFVKSGLLKAVGKMADYQIILNAAGWLEKGVLDESDLAEIQLSMETKTLWRFLALKTERRHDRFDTGKGNISGASRQLYFWQTK